MQNRFVLSVIVVMVLSSFCFAQDQASRPIRWATPVKEPSLKNFYKVDGQLYRSAQPDAVGMKALERQGVKSVLNLREFHADNDEANGTKLKLYHVPMNAAGIKDEDIVTVLKIIRQAQGPVLVHCWHGSDRTGVVTAMYRIVYQDWTKVAAIDELVNGGYGYHSIYGNIVTYIENVDVALIKRALESTNLDKTSK